MKRYELVEGAGAKFWQFEVRGSDLVVEYGRLGTNGQSKTKSFDSPGEAEAAAAKLVKEKTGKGYRLVGAEAANEGNTAGSVPAAKAKPPADKTDASPAAGTLGSSPTELPEWLSEAQLAELAAKLGKKSKRSPSDLADQVVDTDDGGTWGRRSYQPDAAIAILIDRGQFPDKLIPEVFGEAISAWAFMRPETLLSLIRRPDFDDSRAESALMRLGTADPALLRPELDAALPAAAARIAPLVRRRLGLSEEPLSDELIDKLVEEFLRGSGSFGGQIERRGRCLVDRYFSTYAAYRDYVVATFGITDWDARVAKAAAKNGFGGGEHAEPLFLTAPVAKLAKLLKEAEDVDGSTLFRWLETRGDSAADLVRVVEAMRPGKPIWGNAEAYRVREAVAVVAGARLAEEGKPIPEQLVECIWFLDNLPPTAPNHAYARALAKWPAALVHGRVRELIKPPKEPKRISSSDDMPLGAPVRVAVGLGVHPEPALTAQLLDSLIWDHLQNAAAYVGRLGMDYLPELVARNERATPKSRELYLAIQTTLVDAAEKTGQPFDAEYDLHFEPYKCHNTAPWQRAVTLLPSARRDAYYLAWAKRDPFGYQPGLYRVSDETLDQIIGLMFAMRNADTVYGPYPKSVSFDGVDRTLTPCAERALASIEKHYRASGGDAKARELLAHMPLQPEAYAELVGGAPLATPPAELDAAVASRLSELFAELAEEATVSLPSGAIAVANSGHAQPRRLRHKAPKGKARLLVHYDDDAEGTTAGLDALCLRFTDTTPVQWEEDPKALDSDLVGLVFGDEKAFDRLEDDDRDTIDELVQSHVAHGDAVAMHGKSLVVAYVGEEALEHQVYWGFDSARQPVCVLARFSS